MIRRPPRSTRVRSSAASDVYKRQDVLQRYRVSYVLQSSVLGSTPTWVALEHTITDAEKSGTQVQTAQRGQVIDLGRGAYLEVLSPDRSVPNVDTNDACVVTRLVYGKTSFMLS